MTVYLVGAGPGSPDLLTVRAARLLAAADIVVHDRLVDSRILEMAPSTATVIDAGKYPGGPSDAQAHINAVLVDAARRTSVVVRLKGGDPYVFGRGGEEAVALRSAGVEVEVVPGVSSAIAGPAAAGIPVTMRGLSSGFTVVTGHQDPAGTDPLDWEALARLGTTLVVLMGASRAATIADRLLTAGMAPATPVAAVESATSVEQRVLRSRLDELADLAEGTIQAPAVLVVGEVAGLDVADAEFGALVSEMASETGGGR